MQEHATAGGAQHEPVVVLTVREWRARLACVACSGARLAAGGGDGALRLWRWRPALGWQAAGERRRAHLYGVAAVQFAASGVLLATAGGDGVARVWAAEALTERRVLAAPGAAAARALCWAGGERLCVGHDDGALRVWAVRAGALLAYVRAHEGALCALAAPAGGALLLAACSEGVLKAYDTVELARGGVAGGPGPAPLLWQDGAHDLGALCGCAWARGAATGGRDALVRVWRVRGAGRARSLVARGALSGHAAAVSGLASARGVLASASLDGTARLWAAEAGACLRVLAAHERPVACVALAADLRYAVTGADDGALRTWPLGAPTLALCDELEPACAPAQHFALGDLQGIGPVAEAPDTTAGHADAEAEAGAPASVWRAPSGAAINCLASSGSLLAAACSDGYVRLFSVGGGCLRLTLELAAHAYAALAVDLRSGLLLSAGRDGRARLWDAQGGARAALAAAGLPGADDGGGAVRDARLSPARPRLLLLASDDGVAAIWGVDPLAPEPLHVFAALSDAATCCAWTRDGLAAAVGGAGGELQLLAPPPAATVLCARADAHDAGVLSCDFERGVAAGAGTHLLATGGRDGHVHLWRAAGGALAAEDARAAHEGGAQCVRWGAGGAAALLATGGVDRWARVWRVAVAQGRAELSALATLPAAAGGAVATCMVAGRVAVGSLGGVLALWPLPAERAAEEGAEPRAWVSAGVLRWLCEYVTRVPDLAAGAEAGAEVSAEAARVERAARELDGARLLDAPLRELLHFFGYATENDAKLGTDATDATNATDATDATGATDDTDSTDSMNVTDAINEPDTADVPGESKGADGVHEVDVTQAHDATDAADADATSALLERLRDEILWLRRDDVPDELEARAPHSLRCPLTHRVLREPVRAADGYTYERQNFLHWQLASGPGELRSPVSGRRLHSALLAPNYGVREELRQFVGWPRLEPAPTEPRDC